jgi:hypothetical protein
MSSRYAVAMLIAFLFVQTVMGDVCPTYDSTQPGTNSFGSHAYDEHRGVTVWYAGRDKQTWEWDGSSWAFRGFGGPPWISHDIVYDSVRQVMVAYGSDQGAAIGETWEWNGDQWVYRTNGGPSGRGGFDMAFDPVRGVTVMFGGSSSTIGINSETWEWDGVEWQLRTTDGPLARTGHAMVYDPTLGAVVLHGGHNPPTPFGDMWKWDGNEWTEITSNHIPRLAHQLWFDPLQQRLMMFGGVNGEPGGVYVPGTWLFQDGKWELLEVESPEQRGNHDIAVDLNRNIAVMVGGNNNDYPFFFRDTWEWDGKSWVQRRLPFPARRSSLAMTYDPVNTCTVLFGGSGLNAQDFADTWTWKGDTWTLHEVDGPPARSGHAMAYDSNRNVTVLFGGDGEIHFGDTWEWNGTTWSWVSHSGPTARWDHATTFDVSRNVVVLFGGRGPGFNGDTWEWDGTNWVLRATTGPSPRSLHAMAYDESRGVVVLFGGYMSGTIYNGETWEYDGATGEWTLRSTSGPPPRRAARMVYDASRKVCVMLGGQQDGIQAGDEVWVWNGIQWTSNGEVGPMHRDWHGMAYDSDRAATVIFGGGNNRDDLWHLTLSPIGDSNCDDAVDVADLMTVIDSWGDCRQPCSADVSPYGGNGVIDVDDLMGVIDHWD